MKDVNTNGNPGPLFLVVNLCEHELESTGRGEHGARRSLRHDRRPKYLHETCDEAETEALRLEKEVGSSSRTFVVFEAVMWSCTKTPFEIGASPVSFLEPIESPAIQIPERPRKKSKVKAPKKSLP
ncbi:MAG: hypothetical protein V4662_25130 [Verrucomicrobiota bacterium]